MKRATGTGAVLAAVVALAVLPAPAMGLGAGGIKGNAGSTAATLSGDGQIMAFSSFATNLHPAVLTSDGGGGSEVFVRDLQTGAVSLVSRATGTTSEDGNLNSFDPVISRNGRYVSFTSSSTNLSPNHTNPGFNVFRRDLLTNTTANANGVNGCQGCFGRAISADGRYVAFFSQFDLVNDDTNNRSDVYVYDFQTGTTTLVSRGPGAAGVIGNGDSSSAAISDDGRLVAFSSTSTTFDPADPDAVRDIYVRDLQSHTTTLVSRATGPAGTKGSGSDPAISPDGQFVAFISTSTFDPADADSLFDVYVRDLQTHDTILVSRAGGLAGDKANAQSTSPSISADSRWVGFFSGATNLHPDDSDAVRDTYARDLLTHDTVLLDRASGPAGAKSVAGGGPPAFSADRRYVAFGTSSSPGDLSPDDQDDADDIYVRDLQSDFTSLESRATPGYERYVRPQGATPMRLSLVPAAKTCTAPNLTHGPPLAFPSCGPPQPESPNLAVSEGNARLRSVGFVRLDVVPGNPFSPADEADVNIRFSLTNVMNTDDFSDYTGELRPSIQARITDRINGSPPVEEGTVGDFAFEFVVPCVETASTLDGGTCALNTTADAVVPGYATEGSRAVHGLGPVQVFDGGPDGDAETTADNSLFAVQGVFVP